MAAILLEAPASEPLSLAETKAFPRVEHEADDALIAALRSNLSMNSALAPPRVTRRSHRS